MKHFQIHNRFTGFSFTNSNERTIKVNPLVPVIKESRIIKVDQFFSQKQNLVDGFVSTSPIMADDASAAFHFSPFGGQSPLPSDLSDQQIFDMIVSRKIQSPAELSRLRSLRPDLSAFAEDPKPEPAPEPAPEPDVAS